MPTLQIRPHVGRYKRDSYLNKTPSLNPDLPSIDCAVGCSQWGMSSSVRRAHDSFDPNEVSAYSERYHRCVLVKAILDRFNISGLSEDQVFLGHGSFNLAERVIHKLVNPTLLLGVGPQFNEIPTEFVAADGKYEPIPRSSNDGFEFPMARVLDRIGKGLFSMVYIDNPNNPLGVMLDNSKLELIVAQAEKHGILVFIDEAYADFLPDECTAAHLVPFHSNLIVVRSLSKAHGLAALRVGYMWMSKEVAKFYKQLDVPFEPTLYSAVLGVAAMTDYAFMNELRETVRRSKKMAIAAFQDAELEILPSEPTVSIITVQRTGGDVCKEMDKVSILVERGSDFIQTHKGWNDGFCRIRMPAPQHMEEFCRRIRTLAP